MVVFTRDDKDLSIPSSLGNFNNAGGGSGSGMTPEEVQGMIDTSIEEYDTEIQVDLEDIRENVSGNTEDIATISGTTGALGEMVASLSAKTKETFYFDVASYFAMGYDDRRDYFDLVYAKVEQGADVFAVGTAEGDNQTVRIPLIKYKAETDPSTHTSGWLYFSAKAPQYNNNSNLYFSFSTSSVGNISGLNSSGLFASQTIYTLPSSVTDGIEALSASTSALTEGLDNVYGQTTANTQDIESVSGAVVTLSASLSGYTTTDTFNSQISAVTGQISGVSADVEELSGKTGEVYDEIFYEDEGERYSQIQDLWDAVDGKQDSFEIADGLQWDERDGALEAKIGKGLWFKGGGEITVRPGSGVTVNIDTGAVDVKIGEGLGFSGDTLVVSGISGGGSDYVIVDDLEDIEEPYEGLIAYVRSTSSLTEYSYFYFPNPNDYPTEGYVGYIKNGNEGEDTAVYVSSNYFYWDWENDGDWHTRDSWYEYKYRCVRDENDASNSQFWVIFPEGSGLYLEPSAEVATGTSEITVWNYSQPVVYNNGVWVPVGGKVYNFGNVEPTDIFATSAETIAFMDEVVSSAERGGFPQIYLQGHIFTYSKDNSPWVNFKSMFDYNQSWNIYFSDTVFDDNGFNSAGIRCDKNNIVNDPDLSMVLGGVDSGGTNSSNLQDYLGDDYGRDHYLYRYALRTWNPENPDEIWGLGLVKWWYRYKVEWQDSEEGWRWYYVIAADVPVETTIYSGVWGWIDNEHIETLEWTSGATYESQTYTKYVPQ